MSVYVIWELFRTKITFVRTAKTNIASGDKMTNDPVAAKVPGKLEDNISISHLRNGDGESIYYVVYAEHREPKNVWKQFFDTEEKVIAYLRRYMFKHQDERGFLDNLK